MSDKFDPKDPDFKDLRAGLRRPPVPGGDAKAAAMALAMQNFDRLHQGSADDLRLTSDRPQRAGFLTGVRKMFSKLTTRPMLAATTSVAALCLGLIVVLPIGLPGNAPDLTQPEVPVAADPAADALRGRVETALSQDAAKPAEEAATEPMVVTEAAPADANVGQAAPHDAPAPAPMPLQKRAAPSAAVGQLAETRGMADALSSVSEPAPLPEANTEAFANEMANPIKVTAEEPVSTFSVDVDTASYAVVRQSLMSGQMPPAAAVRIEEMVNYFPYAYPTPAADETPFKASVSVMQTPWNAGTQLVRIGLQGRLPALEDRPPLNLVFLIDTSGSMNQPSKLPLLKQSLRLMLAQLRPEDEVAIVAYAGSAGEVLAPTKAGESATIMDALDRLAAGGSTAGAEGLELAYRVAERMGSAGEVSRVLLATDGDFNVGVSDPEGLEAYVAKQRASGTYLSVLGFGRGNLDDAVMQALAQSGNGTAAYIDTLQEARKVLVDQLSGALFPIADDVKIQVEWNPAQVAEYRLIGYETRALAREDFNNDKVDAGEIGAGHAVTALYEVTAPDSPARATDPLRYGEAVAASATGELGFLRLRYKAPGQSTSALIETPIVAGDTAPDADAKFAAAIAGFGQLLTGAKYLGDWGWDDAVALALEGRGADEFGYRAEAMNLMRLAQALAGK